MTALGGRSGAKVSCAGMDLLLLFFMTAGEELQTCAVFRGSKAVDWKDRVEEMELERTGLDSGSNESPGERER